MRLRSWERKSTGIQPESSVAKVHSLLTLHFPRKRQLISSTGHNATLDYIKKTIGDLGSYYTVSTQNFTAVSGNVFASRLVIGDKVIKDARPMGNTPPTKHKQPVYGQLLESKLGCNLSDFPKNPPKNWIALIKRGECAFGVKSENAGKAGASAAIVYNNEEGVLPGTLQDPTPDQIATFGIGLEDAKPWLEKLGNNTYVDSIAYIDAIVQKITTTNVVAQTTDGDQDNCVMLGGHSDSVAEGPGINDDGSGTISLLEVATQLTKFKVNNCVRFAWWAGEEEGLLGSNYYVSQLSDKENAKIRLFMDYDMMASPNFAYQVYNASNGQNPTGSEELKTLYTDWYAAHGLNYTYIPFDGRSDYVGFITNGIPGGGLATGAEGVKTEHEALQFGGTAGLWFDPCYHQLCDDVGNVNMTAWEVNTKLIAHSVAVYAKSFKGFPEREHKAMVEEQSADKGVTMKWRGSKLII